MWTDLLLPPVLLSEARRPPTSRFAYSEEVTGASLLTPRAPRLATSDRLSQRHLRCFNPRYASPPLPGGSRSRRMPGEPLDAPDDLCKQALSQLAFGQLQVEAGDGAVVSRSRCSLPRLVLVNFLARASALLRGLSGASSLTRRLVVATTVTKVAGFGPVP